VRIVAVNADPDAAVVRVLSEFKADGRKQAAEFALVYDESGQRLDHYQFRVLKPGDFAEDEYPSDVSELDKTDLDLLKRIMADLNKTFGSSFYLTIPSQKVEADEDEPRRDLSSPQHSSLPRKEETDERD